jgi:hypothetical protein
VKALKEKINQRYLKLGFRLLKTTEEYSVFQNKFSVHFIFFCGNPESFLEKYSTYHATFNDKYLKGDLSPDTYWNFYEIYIFESGDSEEFKTFKEKTEMDFRMSRKYVFLAKEINNLPPLFLSFTRKQGFVESPWEEEWRNSVGEELYDCIIDSPKSRVEDVLRGYLDDKFNKD